MKFNEDAQAINAGKIPKNTLKKSARRETAYIMEDLNVIIKYGSPGVRSRAIAAGSCGFFTILSTGDWTLILDKNYDQHLADDCTEGEVVVLAQRAHEQIFLRD